MSTSVKISQLVETPVIGPNDSLPIARGTLETFRTPARQFVSEGLNVGQGPGQLFALKSTVTPTTLQFRTLSAVGENLAIATVGNTVVFEMSGQTPYKRSFIGDGVTTIWPLAPFNSVNAANYRVDIDGVLQEPFVNYSLSANQIIFASPPPLSGKIVIVSSNVVRLNEAIVAPDSIETEMLKDGAVTTSKIENSSITLPKLALALQQFLLPPGTVQTFAMSAAPMGWVACNGSSYSTTSSQHSALFVNIGYTFGGSGSTFNVPDLRGEFVRGWSDGKDVGGQSTRLFGSAEEDAIRNITGSFRIRRTSGGTTVSEPIFTTTGVFSQGGTGAEAARFLVGNEAGTGVSRFYNFNASGSVPTAADNRPRNIALLYCIKL